MKKKEKKIEFDSKFSTQFNSIMSKKIIIKMYPCFGACVPHCCDVKSPSLYAEMMYSPGAMISGLIRPSKVGLFKRIDGFFFLSCK